MKGNWTTQQMPFNGRKVLHKYLKIPQKKLSVELCSLYSQCKLCNLVPSWNNSYYLYDLRAKALDVHVYSLYSIYCNHINKALFLWASCMRHGNSFVLEHSLCIFCFNRILSHMAVNSTKRISLGEFICKTYPLCLPCAMLAYWTSRTSDTLVSEVQGEEFLTFPSETGDLPDLEITVVWSILFKFLYRYRLNHIFRIPSDYYYIITI